MAEFNRRGTEFNRRDLFVIGGAAMGTAVLATSLEGCAGLSQQASQLVQDVDNTITGLNGMLPDIQTVAGVAAGVVANVENWLADATNMAAAIESAAGSAASQVPGLVTGFAQDVNNVVGALGVQNGLLGAVLQAAQVLVPIILGAAGIALAGPSAPTSMLPAQARGVLKAASAR